MTAVELRPVEPDDLETLFEQQADPVASEMAAFPSRDHAGFFGHWNNRVLANPDGIVRAIVVDGALAGNVLSWVDPDSGHREMGYWLGRDFWGKGIATEAVRRYLLEVVERPIHAEVAIHNIGSQRVLEKNGFVRVSDGPTVVDDGVKLFLYRLD